MKRLILMRHAKSDWSGGFGNDHDRPLNQRGRKAAAALGEWLRKQKLFPDQVLCSSAKRTKETCQGLALPDMTEQTFLKPLYLANAGVILNTLQQAQGDIVLLIGHNPGIGMVATAILSDQPDHPHFRKYPTGATLVADFDIPDWAHADWGKANARHFVVPREL
ncbi:histidine phosphatase family protein [Sulfitobacter sp. F26204]|uniref:SixA phosphatase family protein n=1 Tax=Sulfitobacter sp. F26204 TaxID=2996014 RepID=UPI00225DD237|nr:histidine phosphatase family protein [Sulfitobacter sp. F26204]MCX7558721.1 histidine phosphatase family protein [Sulfitobacter sp. F26204]